ncbi:hypothetical protein EDD17DRAFT_1515184 [Pisolithus thermaeus]|nr:hypothetical protein EDD17DRAFT_1515184 [Pisolithus thermaeus]
MTPVFPSAAFLAILLEVNSLVYQDKFCYIRVRRWHRDHVLKDSQTSALPCNGALPPTGGPVAQRIISLGDGSVNPQFRMGMEQDVGYVEAIWLLSAPVAARTDTIDDGSAQCGKVEAYCTGHKKQNGRSTCKRTGNWFTLASWLTSKPATQWQALEKGASLTSVLLLPTSTRRKSTMKYRKAEIPATIDITQSSTSRGTSAEITFMDVKLEARQRSFWSFRTLSRELSSEQVSLFWDRAKLKLSGQKFFLLVRHWYWGVLVWRSNSEERPSSQVNIVLRDVKCQKRVAAAIDMVNAVS